MGMLGEATPHPFRLPARIWQNMSPQEQEMLRSRWSKMSPEQQRRAVNAFQQRDTAAVRFQRRFTPPAPKQPPTRQPPATQSPP
jgi:lysyl-tRNA synthetase class I